jgi:integrase
MARTLNRLSPTEVSKTSAGPRTLNDGGGLYLRISEAGTKLWGFRYTRPGGGKVNEIGLGSYPAVSLANARLLRQVQHGHLAKGLDPADAKKAEQEALRTQREIPTFGEIADEYIRERAAPKSRNAKHKYQWEQTLGDGYCKSLRSMRVDEIDTKHIVAVLCQHRSVKVKGGRGLVAEGQLWTLMPETADRLRNRLEQVLEYAAVTVPGMAGKPNPARWGGHLEHHKLPARQEQDEERHQPAMPYAGVPAFIKALRAREAVSARALEFLILTAARSGEVRGATWDEIDLEKATWTVPAARMKARKEHRVPLTARCIEILKEMAPEEGVWHGLVFPSNDARAPMSDMVFNALMRRMKVENATAHGFRSSFRDWVGEETDFDGALAEAALAHVVGSAVERAYRRDTAFQRRARLMDAWADYCAGVKPAGNVLPFRAQA